MDWGLSGADGEAFTALVTLHSRRSFHDQQRLRSRTRTASSPILGRDAGAEAVAAWLDGCQAELVHPGLVEERLTRAGWAESSASAIALRYRRRFAEHHLGYSALLVATGLGALAAGSAGHVLVAGLSRPVNRRALSGWLTVLVCALPFAGWAHWWAGSWSTT